MVLEGNMLIDDLENLPQITIAAVNGPARGSGVEISLACDIRYAAASASFQQHEADMGGFPGGGAPLRLPMLVGYARTIEMLCTARAVPRSDEHTSDLQSLMRISYAVCCLKNKRQTI